MLLRSTFAQVFLWPLCVACSARSLSEATPEPGLDEPVASSVAAAGKVRLFVGQDLISIGDYVEAVAAPRGVVSYTSLSGLEGLDAMSDQGGGPMHLAELASEHPGVPIALGLYLTGALPAVNDGALDSNLDLLAEALSSYSVPVLLRVGYEFDADWNQFDPNAYRSAFAKIAGRLRSSAPNVELVWQAAASCGGTYLGKPVEEWYPGDDVVDWVSASYFVQSTCQHAPIKRLLHFAREHGKPFFFAESAPQGYDLSDATYSPNGRDRQERTGRQIFDEWYVPYFDLIEESLDVVRAVAYINADWDTQWMWAAPYPNGYFGDSRVQANPEVLAGFRDRLSQSHWEPSP